MVNAIRVRYVGGQAREDWCFSAEIRRDDYSQ